MLNKFSRKIGLTLTELRVILFLLIAFAVGIIYKGFVNSETTSEYITYDYSKQDSLFALSDSLQKNRSNFDENNSENVDYKQEVLDFNKRNFSKKEEKTLPAEKSINLNNASIDQLKLLPGIGEVTAQRIIDYRKKKNFNNLNQLHDIKGIGNVKFNNIKKYLYIGK